MTGEISYNGYNLQDFVVQKVSSYVGQYDQHIPEITVRETLDFSGRCQGIGNRAGWSFCVEKTLKLCCLFMYCSCSFRNFDEARQKGDRGKYCCRP